MREYFTSFEYRRRMIVYIVRENEDCILQDARGTTGRVATVIQM